MLLLGYLFVASALNVLLGFLVQFKAYSKSFRFVLLGLSGLFTAHLWLAYAAVFADSPENGFVLQRWLMGLGLISAVGILELTRHFLRKKDEEAILTWGQWRISIFWMAVAVALAGEVLLLIPGVVVSNGLSLKFEGAGVMIPIFQVLLAIYGMYLLENTYRYAQDYQRRIGRLCFISLGVLLMFHIVTFSRVILYRAMPLNYAEASSVVYGVVFPVVLVGFLRYRLGAERISIPRDAVYTSATIFLTGAVFLGIALTGFAFQWWKLDFTYFERFFLGFTLFFLAVLILGSGTMRRRVSRFIDQQFYSRKYDYQDQFFRLHRAGLSGTVLDTAAIELVENMKYSVSVDDAHFFHLNWQDGNFYQHENKEEATRRGLIISGDSPMACKLNEGLSPLDLLNPMLSRQDRQALSDDALVKELQIDAVFPITVGDRLGGILALKGGRRSAFDDEDLALIKVFTSAIGDALFKNRVLNERIEQKQFESYHHVASFIIHDIKNQIATLNLIMKNAERNMANPAFQSSMMSSIHSCATNLQSLIDRLAVAPNGHEALITLNPIKPLLSKVLINSGLSSLPGLKVDFLEDTDFAAPMDSQGLFFVVRNLVNNAVEAMGGKGRIALSFGKLNQGVPVRLRSLFGGGEQFFSGFGAWILIEDSGPGMDPEFVRKRLFQPFATTKEKGVGIGLYQSRTLVEKMGGRIICHSELGHGTEFCILLPAVSRDQTPIATGEKS